MKNNTVTIILVAIVVGALGFFGGMKYQESKSPFGGNGTFRQRGLQGATGNRLQNGQFRARNGFGGGTVGKILSMDADSITVQLMDGSSKIVNISDKTTIAKTATASKSELKTGESILAIGAANTDGSITAERIQLNPPQLMNRPASPSGMPAQ